MLAQTDGHQNEWAAVKARQWTDFHWHPDRNGTIVVIDPIAVDFAFLRGAKFKGGFTVITHTKANLAVRQLKSISLGQERSPQSGRDLR